MKVTALCFFVFASIGSVAQYKLYEKGFSSYKAEKYDDAIRFFSEYLTKSTRDKSIDVDVFYLRALSHYKLNQFADALPDFEESVLRNHHNKGNIYWFMAKAYQGLSQDEECFNSYSSAIREFQGNADLLAKLRYERALLYKKTGKVDLAILDLQAAYAAKTNDPAIKRELDALNAPHAVVMQTGTPEKDKGQETSPNKNQPDGNKLSKEEPDLVTTQRAGDNAISAAPDNSTPENHNPLAELYRDEKRYALVIGISNYSREVGVLRNPVNDASDMAKELEDSHFEVQLLTNATYGQIRAALMRFKEKLDAGEKDKTVGLFYFAGHGVLFEDENYLVPADASVQYEDDIPRYCFPIQRMVLGNMERSNTRMNIVILDACRNNPFPAVTRSGPRAGLGEMKRGKGTFIAYATAPGAVASDGHGRNGLYTQELLKALKKPGLTIEQVFKEVRANVLTLSGSKQNTWDSSNIVGEFHFKY
jgi:tetratricopeptide (TPR) repeat protein